MMFENVAGAGDDREFPVTGNTLSFSDSIFSSAP